MNKVRQWNLWPPVFYTIVWTAGFLIGIFGFMEDAEGPLKLVVSAFTAYSIFLVNAVIDFWILLVKNLRLDARPSVAYVLIALAVVMLATIVLSNQYVLSGNLDWFVVVACLMVVSFFCMEAIKANSEFCFVETRGRVYTSNL